MFSFKRNSLNTHASYIFAAAFLLLILLNGLLGALLAGLLMFSLIHLLTPVLSRKIRSDRARLVAAASIGAVLLVILAFAIWKITLFFSGDGSRLTHLFQKMADIIDATRHQLPPWLNEHLPIDAEALRHSITNGLRAHAAEARIIGTEAGRSIAHILIGLVIGVMVALQETVPSDNHRPFAQALLQRAHHLQEAFRNIVFAQVWISGINTLITAIFILIVLPLFGVNLPLAKTLIAITFFAGLLPVIGNLISNTVLVVVALSYSLDVAISCLVFMVVVHKLEYFLNARIIGSRINAHAWELLIVMLIAEAMFGMAGVIAAPVFYAYAKRELTERGLI